MSNNITCPNCGHTFSLSDVQKHELEHLKTQMHEEMKQSMQKDFDERAKTYALKVKQEAEELAKKAERDAQEKNQKQTIELESLRKRDEESRVKEMAFLREKQEMEMQQKNLEIEKEKAIIEARKQIEADLSKQANERLALEMEKAYRENEKKFAEKEQQLEQLRRSLEDANRKATQGSMQIQGEIQEDALKAMLQAEFIFDIISDVEKGIKGADIIQEVRNEYGQSVGIIAWESKNTKAWSDSWIDKLKEDRLRVNAGVSIIVSSVLPEGITHFGLYRDIWVTSYESALPLTFALRTHMMELSKTRNSLKGKDEKMEALYHYLISPEFKAKIENIVEAFTSMRDSLDQEKRAMERIWSAREKQLERVISNTSRLYGDMQGLIGAQLPKVEYLELGSGEE
ncbi:MAG: DUF2130 domain-containing protein [Candidatus Gracilibacteria bacterium]|nr:DUF2130 domain-containing protein [Candidatus Gracilibacteria bacterium]